MIVIETKIIIIMIDLSDASITINIIILLVVRSSHQYIIAIYVQNLQSVNVYSEPTVRAVMGTVLLWLGSVIIRSL